MGHMLYHDDSLNDRSSGSSLEVAFKATIKLWKATYNEMSYHCPGGMYRGEPPCTYWSPNWPEENPLKLTASSWEDAAEKFRSVSDFSINGESKEDMNERMIFGYGRLGRGLYSLDTKEGVEILLDRVRRRCKNRSWYYYDCPTTMYRLTWVCFYYDDYDIYSGEIDNIRQHWLIHKIRWTLANLMTLLFASLPYLVFILLDPIVWKYENLRIFLSTLLLLDGPPESFDGMSLPKLQDKWRESFVGDHESSNYNHLKLSGSILEKFPN